MDYPRCAENYMIDKIQYEINDIIIKCRPLTDIEIRTNHYIQGLLNALYLIPLIALSLLCISCMNSRTRIYRVGKEVIVSEV